MRYVEFYKKAFTGRSIAVVHFNNWDKPFAAILIMLVFLAITFIANPGKAFAG
jgi:hypothetical protein